MLKLIGILIIVIGFIRKYDTIAVVLTAGVVTGLVSGLGFNEILTTIGSAFVKTRYMSIFLLTLPVIGVLERYGLRERASDIIKSKKTITSGKVLSGWTVVRTIAAALALRLGGHVQFIRPLINPMAFAALKNKYPNAGEEEEETIKGLAAASENYGNFFGQNVFVASGGVLLVVATLEESGINVTPLSVSKSAIPIMVIAVVFAIIQYWLAEKKFIKKLEKQSEVTK